MVRETIESVRVSSLADYRVVISDNRSDEAARQATAAYVAALDDPRFTFVVQPENGGEYGQGRFFLEQSEGAEYFVILHDDDLIDPDYLRLAVEHLNASTDAALLVANPRLIDEEGTVSDDLTRRYLKEHGRAERSTGLFPILETVLGTGFVPISGTVFRRSALCESGFVDDDCYGNFPFELNVMLRLGDRGLKGWFLDEMLLSVRYHHGSLRNTLGLMRNSEVVATMLKLLERRSYSGSAEMRRVVLVARLHRAMAEIHLANGDVAAAKTAIATACRLRPQSPNAWRLRAKLMMGSAKA